MTDEAMLRALEAVIFAAAAPLTLGEIAVHVGDRGDLADQLATLAARYAPRGINLVQRGGRWQFQTADDLAHHLRPTREWSRKLSRAATETATDSGWARAYTTSAGRNRAGLWSESRTGKKANPAGAVASRAGGRPV